LLPPNQSPVKGHLKTTPKLSHQDPTNESRLRKAVILAPPLADGIILKHLEKESLFENQFVGYLAFEKPQSVSYNGLPCLGNIDNLDAIIKRHEIKDIYLPLAISNYNQIHPVLNRLVNHSYNVWVINARGSELSKSHPTKSEPTVPGDNISLKSLSKSQRIIKRVLDLLLGAILQLLALPVMFFIGLIIKLDSPGPAIFKQLRVGENGKLFHIYKFRTMFDGSEEQIETDLIYDQDGNINHKIPDDPRVTRIGRFLRKTSLDELPQFLNVLNGDMSLVGPRPELPVIVASYMPWQYNRFIVPQGVTGWWQVNGRSDRPMHLHTEDDIYYIRNYSFLLDISIIARTIWVIIKGIGAY
jgi:exopolysaccharide biosynthesis polyprenyl glycosylphosphotransferase